MFLRDSWATDWRKQGNRASQGNRSTAVTVNNVTLIATYQPLWSGDLAVISAYREELNSQIMQCKQQNDLIIGGDFNASIGETTDREEDQAAGPHGLGRTNPAGHDLLNWCHEQGLAWGNSFFEHNLRGTWQCPSRNSWHEIDGFLVRQKNRSKCLKSVNTVTTARSLSDHWPKSLTGWLQRPTPRRQPRAQKNNTNWEALKDPITRAKFQSETERETEKQSGGRWTELIAGIAKAGKRVCGTKGKVALSPWLDRHEREIKGFKEKITTLIKRAKEASTQEGKHRWTVFRKQVRKLYKLAKKNGKKSGG